jgi:hypothetical protein
VTLTTNGTIMRRGRDAVVDVLRSENVRLRYGMSMFHCLPRSLLGGGAGLGGLMGETTARELATEARVHERRVRRR